MKNSYVKSCIYFSLLFTISIVFYSCSSFEKFYNRPENPESQLLNEYLYSFIMSTEPYHQRSQIHLNDELFLPKDSYCCGELNSYSDSLFYEAHMNLKKIIDDKNKKSVPINFRQLVSISDYKVIPKAIKDFDYNNWSYNLSLPGFSNDSTHIVFISSYYCGLLCASIDLNFMKKVNKKWMFIKQINIMTS